MNTRTVECNSDTFEETLAALKREGFVVVSASVVGISGWRLHAREALPVQSELLPTEPAPPPPA
jgi:hypothetical protein